MWENTAPGTELPVLCRYRPTAARRYACSYTYYLHLVVSNVTNPGLVVKCVNILILLAWRRHVPVAVLIMKDVQAISCRQRRAQLSLGWNVWTTPHDTLTATKKTSMYRHFFSIRLFVKKNIKAICHTSGFNQLSPRLEKKVKMSTRNYFLLIFIIHCNWNKNKHNAQLQRADHGTIFTG